MRGPDAPRRREATEAFVLQLRQAAPQRRQTAYASRGVRVCASRAPAYAWFRRIAWGMTESLGALRVTPATIPTTATIAVTSIQLKPRGEDGKTSHQA